MARLLTIGIPTYNRVVDLAQCLDSIKAAWKPEFEGMVELLVSSNASDDGTDEMLAAWSLPGLPLRIHRWSENVGPIPNFLRVVEQSQSEYCWLLSDDDAIERCALADVLAYLTTNPNAGGLTLEASAWNSELTAPVAPLQIPHSIPATLLDRKEIWAECLHDWGLLSVCIVNVGLWRECQAGLPIPADDAYPHVWIQAEMARRSQCWGYQRYPVVRWRTDRDSFLKNHGALKRALMPVESFGNIAKHYQSSDPLLSKFALNICCGAARHYIRRHKLGKISSFSSSWQILKSCIRHSGWKSSKFFTEVLPSFALPSVIHAVVRRVP